MRRLLITIGVLLVPLLVAGAVFWNRSRETAARFAEARGRVGTRGAAATFDQLARAYPSRAEAFVLVDRQARLEGRLDDARSALDKAEGLGWPAGEIDRERLLVRAAADFPRARPELETRLAAAPDDRDLLLALAAGFQKQGANSRASELAGRVLATSPNDPAALFLRGIAWQEGRRLDLARADLEAAVAAGPNALDYPKARQALAICLLDLGDFPPAADLFRAALADDPDDVYALFGSGRAAGFLGQWAEAETFYKAVLVRRPGHVETLLAIAQVREQQGDAKAALADLEQAAAGDPNRLETLYRLAKLLRVTGQNERAAEYEAKYRDLQGRLIKEAAAVPPAEPIKEEPR